MRNEGYFNRFWYEGDRSPWWARALSLLFCLVTSTRRLLYHHGVLRRSHPGVPVVVIGNLVAGGAGKTPLTIALIRQLTERGLKVGVVSRGYGGSPGKEPVLISETTTAQQAGDEAVLIAQRTGVPVCVHPKRALAAQKLVEAARPDVLLCDDGLQHYALARDVEIVVVDGLRGLGNGRLLPAGPLREAATRFEFVEHIVINGTLSRGATASIPAAVRERAQHMRLTPVAMVNLKTGERRAPDALVQLRCAAVAGIGHPQRFFETVSTLGYEAECRAYPDHHGYTPDDMQFAGERPLLMTEKDAVKCRAFAKRDWWYLEVSAALEPLFVEILVKQIEVSRQRLMETST